MMDASERPDDEILQELQMVPQGDKQVSEQLSFY